MFTPTRAAAQAKLSAFVPHASKAYAVGRNYDLPDRGRPAVSLLSPYIRHRLISETEVIAAVLDHHNAKDTEKFLQEVFWRTYWKGWLELRPQVWADYRSDVSAGLNRLHSEAGLRAEFDTACLGETEIECFNYWTHTLVNTGYIHNHARMWFASIWVFTLRLPWALGADFFLRHLLDGDPASNTLSWRWVAGLQTKGKTYLATPDNIAEFTNGRFQPAAGSLAAHAEPLIGPDHPAPSPIGVPAAPQADLRTGLLLHNDDVWLDQPVSTEIMSTCAIDTSAGRSPLAVAPLVQGFSKSALNDALTQHSAKGAVLSEQQQILEWARTHNLQQIVTPYAPVGPVAELLVRLESQLREMGVHLARMQRDYDALCWPRAIKGFFPFKANIPEFISKI